MSSEPSTLIRAQLHERREVRCSRFDSQCFRRMSEYAGLQGLLDAHSAEIEATLSSDEVNYLERSAAAMKNAYVRTRAVSTTKPDFSDEERTAEHGLRHDLLITFYDLLEQAFDVSLSWSPTARREATKLAHLARCEACQEGY